MKTTVKQIYDFYKKHPKHIGKVKTLTPFGMKTIQGADITAYNSEIISISTDSKLLECSPNHRVRFNNKWVHVVDLRLGDLIDTVDGSESVNGISKLDLREDLYDFQVEEVHQYYTNGILSHNSSFLEAIPFAIFGQTGKGVPLNKIINWKNGKAAETRLHFRKDGIKYELQRGIKPGILELIKDGSNVPKLSDKRIFQQEIETDLIGMDFRAAQAIHFQNANNMISMFNTPKADKRKFIEKFFNLEVYSQLNELANSKLRGIELKRSELDSERSFKQKRAVELEDEIRRCIAPNIEDYELSVVAAEAALNDFRSSNKEALLYNETTLSEQFESVRATVEVKRKELDVLRGKIKAIELELRGLEVQKASLTKRVIDIGDLSAQRDKLNRLRDGLVLIGNLDIQADEHRKALAAHSLDKDIIEKKKTELQTEMRLVEKEIRKWQSTNILEDSDCPTCFQKSNPEHIKVHVDTQVQFYTTKFNELQVELETQLVTLRDVVEKLTKAREALTLVEDKNSKKVVIEKRIAELSNVSEKEAELVSINIQLTECDSKLTVLSASHATENGSIPLLEASVLRANSLVEETQKMLDTYRRVSAEYVRMVEKVESEKKILASQKEIAERIKLDQEVRIASKAQLELELAGWDAQYKKLDTMKDYLSYIKETLKDENVKQYAISNIVPFVQKQTNHYLAETGHNYYIELDNWLEGTIKGFGVGESDFGNMSGGEGKSIDLALKFAMMDVARSQAGSYLDILVLDELLDSSIDSFGLERTIDIVRLKQREDLLKVFVVSHRDEIGAFDFDHTYNVVKENGFSAISVV
jgi:DNA repair exonuclease SbcCD ATPase subunit